MSARVLIPLVVAVAIAAVPASLSVALRPWLYAVKIAAFDLPGETTLVELARVESLHIYAGTLQTLMTEVNDWPTVKTKTAKPRDACLIATAAKDADALPPTHTWTDRTIQRMFNDRVKPDEARGAEARGAYDGGSALNGEIASAVKFLHAIEPYNERVQFGEVRYFAVPESMEYRRRTGIRYILSAAVEPTRTERPGNSDKEAGPSATLTTPIAQAIDLARERGVRFLAIPFLGANAGDGFDTDVYKALLDAAMEAAVASKSLRALYIGAYADSPVRRRELISAFNQAWRPVWLKLRARESQLVDVGWRLTSIISITALVSLWTKGRLRNLSVATTLKLSAAILLLAKGLSETISPLIDAMAPQRLPVVVVYALLAAAAGVLGWFLPAVAMFDPRDVVKQEVSQL